MALTAESSGYFCQMDLLEHPGPKAQIHLATYPGAPLFFSQVRDAVAYLRMPEQTDTITATYVNDMGAAASWAEPGATNWIAADKAVYVVGSTAKGGMDAPEFVPFSDPASGRQLCRAERWAGDVPDRDSREAIAVSPANREDDADLPPACTPFPTNGD